MKRVPPSVRLKEEIDNLLQGTAPTAAVAEEPPMVGFVARLARYMLQVAIEAEATAFLGRGDYRRGERQRVGWRNGYEPKHVQSEAGALELAVPQLRGTEDALRPTLAAYALLEDGRPVLLHLDVGPRESYDAWLSFLQDLVARGLRDPLLVVMDGAAGLVKAVKRVWPRAYRQRCQVHKMRNILAKLPRLMQAKMKGLVQQVFLAPTYAVALRRGRDLITKFRDRYPAAMECLERDLEECVTYLRFPEAHHRRIRTTNRLERLNGEGRRRTKVIPRFPTERSCLTLLYASLVAASRLWRGIPMTAAILRQLVQLRAAITPAAKEEAVAM